MTATLISLISISAGIFGAYFLGSIYKRFSLGFIGNTIAGVFGSILVVKMFGRLGFDPNSIVQLEQINIGLFIVNLMVSFSGGVLAVFLISKMKRRMEKV